MELLERILDNFELVATLVAFAAALFLSGKNRSYWRWVNETLFLAWDSAEKYGILEDWKGAEKLEHYLRIWREEYEKRFGEPPNEKMIQHAIKTATNLSEREKAIRTMVNEWANPKS